MKLLKLGLLLALVVGTLTFSRHPSAQQGTCTQECMGKHADCVQTDALQEALCENNASINESTCESNWADFLESCYSLVNYNAAGMGNCDQIYNNLITYYCLVPEQAADEECINQQITADADCDRKLEDCIARCPPGG